MAVQPLASQVGVAPACRALGVPRASFYRRQRPAPGHQQPRPTPARALCASERAHVLDVLASPRFVDRSPAEVVATLLDEGQYLCAERTMYRILAANQPVRERRNQRSHPCYTKPELVATGPNQTWSWDITRLRGPKRWTSFYLYVLLDIFSRCVVGWMVADRENAALAATLIEETCLKQGIEPQVLTLHSDRGAPMTSKCTAQLLANLGVTRSLSRPQVSDDNPFSEAQFKTLKYHPGFPGRFEDAEGVNLPKIMSAAFTAGTKAELTFDNNNTTIDDEDEAFETVGTYNGAMGTYRCVGPAECTVNIDDGKISEIGNGWVFTPNKGVTSDVPDADYLSYGFWLKKTTDEDGVLTYNEVETFAESSLVDVSNVDAVEGSATYNGGATGVYVKNVHKSDGTLIRPPLVTSRRTLT